MSDLDLTCDVSKSSFGTTNFIKYEIRTNFHDAFPAIIITYRSNRDDAAIPELDLSFSSGGIETPENLYQWSEFTQQMSDAWSLATKIIEHHKINTKPYIEPEEKLDPAIKKLPLKYKKKFSLSYDHQARTLDPVNGYIRKTGWTIVGKIHEDYYEWINDFEAFHPKYGRVKGNFESLVEASSKKAYDRFVKDHPFHEWDYYDI
jgi:hypothetical protein